MTIELIVVGIVTLLAGFLIARVVLKKGLNDHEQNSKEKASQILKEAESQGEILKKNKMLEAKEKFLQLKAEHEQEINNKNNLLYINKNLNTNKIYTKKSLNENNKNSNLLYDSNFYSANSNDNISKIMNYNLFYTFLSLKTHTLMK